MELLLPPDFKDFLRLLNAHKVDYLVIGGYAVGYHGYPRATNDLDVWVAVNPENSVKLVQVLKEFGFDTPDLTEELFLVANNVIRMGVPPIKIEVTTGISGVEFEACFQVRIQDQVDGIEINIIDLKHLKINKQASGRLKDLADLENLP